MLTWRTIRQLPVKNIWVDEHGQPCFHSIKVHLKQMRILDGKIASVFVDSCIKPLNSLHSSVSKAHSLPK